jgi:predicted transcriptional regulator
MADSKEQTDEDKMIERLEAHRDFITWVIDKLEAEGISCKRTTGNDAGGDILYYNPEDESKVKEIV